jgi:hypothetical protein
MAMLLFCFCYTSSRMRKGWAIYSRVAVIPELMLCSSVLLSALRHQFPHQPRCLSRLRRNTPHLDDALHLRSIDSWPICFTNIDQHSPNLAFLDFPTASNRRLSTLCFHYRNLPSPPGCLLAWTSYDVSLAPFIALVFTTKFRLFVRSFTAPFWNLHVSSPCLPSYYGNDPREDLLVAEPKTADKLTDSCETYGKPDPWTLTHLQMTTRFFLYSTEI